MGKNHILLAELSSSSDLSTTSLPYNIAGLAGAEGLSTRDSIRLI